jgi:hypothetical protein
MMKRQILILSLALLWVGNLASAATIYVPDRDIQTIQDGLDDANSGDEVVVDQGVWTGHRNVNLDFNGKAITLISSGFNVNAPDWTIVAATIIDVAGDRKSPNRAFDFHRGEGNGSKVIGFTIRNGYMTGGNGRDGGYTTIGGVYQPNPFNLRGSYADPCAPRGEDGGSAVGIGNGYGGAILCTGSSPTIQFCTITNCVVTGSQGGDGANGLSGPWTYRDISAVPPVPKTTNDGQWGGWGGWGFGNGYGGAIACLGGSSPVIKDCNFVNNAARGGCGGNGGNGGIAAANGTDGAESFGGEAGWSIGSGIGGTVYCDNLSSSPTFVNCGFSGSVARTGIVAVGGTRGLGTAGPLPIGPASDGNDGVAQASGLIAGGAAYHSATSNPTFTNCTFIENKAYIGEDATQFTYGGALYFASKNVVDINNCEFIGNLGGAIHFGPNGNLKVKSSYDPNRSSIFQNNQANSGGAIFIDSNNPVSLSNCVFSSNSALFDGGAFKSRSDANMTNCTFGNNTAGGYGGAMDAYRSGTTLKIDANNCIFAGNQSNKGGGFSSQTFSAKFKNCYFNNNTAERGGGLDLVRGDVNFVGGNISGNTATDGDGGGMYCQTTTLDINDCTLSNNSTVNISGNGGYGGAINFYGGVSGQKIFNCLITGNSASENGGAISCISAAPAIGNCTFSGDSAGSYGGAIFADFESEPNIIDSIFNNCSKHAIHEEDVGGNAIVRYSLFYNNTDGDFYDSVTHLVYNGAGQVNNIPGGSGNRYGDPLFVTGPLGAFYLNQSTSPAKDNGSVNANVLGLNTYTTSINNAPDSGLIDIGYHEPNSSGFPSFTLTASVIAGLGTISPTTGSYIAGTVVTLTATPSAGWRVKEWKGADAGGTALVNTVTMNSNKTVTVEFEPPRTLLVSVGGGSGFYSSIQDAITAAKDGDTIIVYPGVYHSGYSGYSVKPIVTVDRSVTITSLHPDDPCCVASTIIDGYRGTNPWVYEGVAFYPQAKSGAILDGFTIRNCGGHVADGEDGDRGQSHPDGYDGGSGGGPGIIIYPGASPVIKNCVITDNLLLAGNGGNGVAADSTHNAGRGGWSGFVWGGAIYCGQNSSPTFINCRIINNNALGGNGGNGGNGVDDGGIGNYGGNFSRTGDSTYPVYNINPFSYGPSSITPVNGPLWQAFNDGQHFFIGDYRWYSGYGGGAFCDVNSNVTFIDCNISGNLARGGMSGIGGETTSTYQYPVDPIRAYEIPAFGGGVYCRAGSTVKFDGCAITNNVASRRMDVAEPNNKLDPYLGHGGGICAEDTAKVIITNCSISSNQANVGGGVDFAYANIEIADTNFISNSANHGGGVYGEEGPAYIANCNITGNNAVSDPNDPNATLGFGGGLHLWAVDVNVRNCNISNNLSETSGGGVYFGGGSQPVLGNCLVTNNQAGRDGGGVSVNWYSLPKVSNCTITSNIVTGDGFGVAYGGGLFSSYFTYTSVINSIIWGNTAITGSQIAVGTGFEYTKMPSTVDVDYSDVQGGAAAVYVDIGNVSDPTDDCKLIWNYATNLTGTSASDPKFVNGFYLSQPSTGDPIQQALGLSPCVDKGSTDAKSAGLYRHTTRTDSVPEEPNSIVDMGYHYVLSTNFVGDFNFDKYVNFLDYILFADHWMSTDCGFPDWCYGTDLDRNGVVNWGDFAIFASNYGAVPIQGPNEPNSPDNDHTPPSPNPMTWASVPTSAGATSITMTATTATDNSGTNVEYYFQRTDANGNPDANSYRNWDSSPTFTDSNHVVSGSQYGYRVKACDTTVNFNETGWSVIGYAVAGSVAVPTAPSGLTATPVSATQINLSWTDNSSNETGFKIERQTGGGSFSQIATTGTNVKTYNNTALTAETVYSYRVRSYNGSGDSGYSNTITATTPAEGNEPNQPLTLPTPVIWYNPPPAVPVDGNNSGQVKTDPNGTASTYWWHKIVAPIQTTPVVYYRFVCTSQSGFSSQWLPSNGTGNVVYLPIVSGDPNPVVKYITNTITYCVPVTMGSVGINLNWRVDVSFNPDGSGEQNHSATKTIYAP